MCRQTNNAMRVTTIIYSRRQCIDTTSSMRVCKIARLHVYGRNVEINLYFVNRIDKIAAIVSYKIRKRPRQYVNVLFRTQS